MWRVCLGLWLFCIAGCSCGETVPPGLGPRVEARPAGGQLRAGAEVQLEGESRTVAIYYTMDGSRPNAERGLLYEGPIALWTPTRLRFVGVDQEGREGIVGQAVYQMDSLFAQTWAEPGAGNYREPQQIVLQSDEPTTIFYTVDGTEPSETSARYLGPIEVSVDTTLRFFSVDLWGNREPVQEVEYNFPPKLKISPPSGVFVPNSMDVRLEASEPGRIEYSLLFGPWSRYVGPFGIQRDVVMTVRAFDLKNLLSDLETVFYGVMEPWKSEEIQGAVRPLVSAMMDPEGFGQPAWIIAERSRLLIWREVGSGSKPTVIAEGGGFAPELLRVWDMDGDGLADILLRRSGGWEFWRALGGDRYSVDLSLFSQWLTLGVRDVLAGDFDGDSQLDLLLLDKTAEQSRILWRRGKVYEASPYLREIGEDSQALASDLDGDGLADIFVLPEKGEPYVLWGDGSGHFERTGLSKALPGLDGLRWVHAARYDVDLDGDLDLVLVGVGKAAEDATVGQAPPASPEATLHLVTLHQIPGRGWRFASRVVHTERAVRGLMWVDGDGDAYMDLLFVMEDGEHLLWKNLGGATWLDASKVADIPKEMKSLGLGDVKVSGRASLYGVQDSGAIQVSSTPSQHPFLRVALRGIQGNRSSLGARMRLQLDGLRVLREIGLGATGPDQPDLFLPIPLGEAKQIGRLSITWGRNLEREVVNPSPEQPLLLSPQSP